MKRPLAAAAAFALAVTAASCGGRVADLPAHGEALVVVDTDLPVPQLAGRLRVDLYAEDGRWFESRDIGRSDPRDWPASFSVFSDDDTRDKRVLVRVRVYPEGVVRDYEGERYAARAPWHEPPVASDLAGLCANAPDLPLGGRVTQRRGGVAVTSLVPHTPTFGETEPTVCLGPSLSGSVAARVTITAQGRYRFDVAGSVPYQVEASLFLRSKCDDPSTQINCMSELVANAFSSGHLARFDATLSPGTYWLMTGGKLPDSPADITLEALPLDVALPQPPEAPPTAAPDPRPRLSPVAAGSTPPDAGGAGDPTPPSEPLPSATIDRLIALRLVPGQRGRVRVTMRAACAGTMAKLGADPHTPDLATAATCVGTGGEGESLLVPVTESALEADMTRPRDTVQGTTGTPVPCSTPPPSADAVCVPGGIFLLGSRIQSTSVSTLAYTGPERLAMMTSFWMDKHEVTVARMRDAVAHGLAYDAYELRTNDVSPLPTAPQLIDGYCTFSSGPMGREDYPVNCLSWSFARAFCRAQGGDLPTEAQWEYAASAAGKPFKTIYPWGDEEPTCDRAVIRRNPPASGGSFACTGPSNTDTGPLPVTAHDGSDGLPGDVSPLGITGLAGGEEEWTLDGGEAYDSSCWNAASVTNPTCVEVNAPYRVARGGSFADDVARTIVRNPLVGGAGAYGEPNATPAWAQVGVRCVYPGAKP